MPPNLATYDLLMDFEHGNYRTSQGALVANSYVQPGEVTPGDNASLLLNGPHIKIVTAAQLLTPVPMPTGWDKLARFYQTPQDPANTPTRYINSVAGYDPLQDDYSPGSTPEYFYPRQYDGQRYFFVSGVGVFDHPLDPADPADGGWTASTGHPKMPAKVVEWSHSDDWVDGALPGYGSAAPYYWSASVPIGGGPGGNRGYSGHNAFGIGMLFSTPSFRQFDPNVQRAWDVPGPTQYTDWRQPRFGVAQGNLTPYWTATFGAGDTTLVNNNAAWPLRPIVPNEFMWFVCEKLQLDFSGAPGDTTPGVCTIWAISNQERIAFGGSLAAAIATQPLVKYSGSTNQWAEPGDTSAYDPNNPDAQRPSGNPRVAPFYMRKRPSFPMPMLQYNVPSVYDYLPTYQSGMRRRTTLQAVFQDLVGSSTPAPVNTSPPTITGSGQVGSTLFGAAGTWIGTPTPSLAYQWLRDGVAIPGATLTSYTLTGADASTLISLRVTGSSTSGTSAATSSSVGPIQTVGSSNIQHEATASYSIFGTGDSQVFNVPNVPNRVMVITYAGKLAADTLATVTVGGVSATLKLSAGQASVRAEMWTFIAPPTGNVTVAWSKAGSAQNVTWGISVFSSVHQSSPYSGANTGGGSGAAAGQKQLTIPSAAGDLAIALAAFNGGATTGGPISGGTGTSRWARNQSTTQGGMLTMPGQAGNLTANWTPSGSPVYDYMIIGGNLLPAVVVPAAPTNQQLPALGGTAQEGQLLSSNVGIWDEHGGSTLYYFAWYRCNSSGGAAVQIPDQPGNTYQCVAADIGKTIRCYITATNPGGSNTAISVQSAVVTAAVLPPTNSAPPTFSGTAQEGQVLTKTSNGTWAQSPTFSFLWLRCDALGLNPVPIAGATGATYTVQAADVGHKIRLLVLGQNAAGQLSVESTASATVTSSAGLARPSLAGYAIAAVAGQTPFTLLIDIAQDAKLLVVPVRDRFGANVTAVTAAGRPLTENVDDLENGNTSGLSLWTLANPPTAPLGPVVITSGPPRTRIAVAFAFKDVNAAAPLGVIAPLQFTGGSAQLTAASAEDDLMVSVLTYTHSATTSPPIDGTGITKIQNGVEVLNATYYTRGESAVKDADAGQTTTTMDFTIGPPAPAAGGTLAVFAVKAAEPANPNPPVPAGGTTIAGTARVGQVLTVTAHGNFNNTDGSTQYTAIWARDTLGDGIFTNVIPGATAMTYTQQAADAHCNVVAVVTATTTAGHAEQQSNVIGPVVPVFGASIIDDFNRATEDPLSQSGGWNGPIQSTEHPLQLLTAGAVTGRVSGDAESWRVGYSLSNTDTMMLVTQVGPGGIGLWNRVKNPGNASTMQAYIGVYITGVGYQIYKVTGGSAFTLVAGTYSSHVHAAGEYLRFSVIGNTKTLYYGVDNGDGTFTWTQVLTSSAESTITGPGSVGIEVAGASYLVGLFAESVVSNPPSNTGLPVISGTPTLEQILTASSGTWAGGPTSLEYSWQANGVDIPGATDHTYTIVPADVGKTITVTVKAINGLGFDTATSTGVGPVAGLAPQISVLPVISGSVYVGGTAGVSNGSWRYAPFGYARQWYRVDADGVSNKTIIAGATGANFTPTSGLVGKRLVVDTVATNATGPSATVTSAPSGVITAIQADLFETLKEPFAAALNVQRWSTITPGTSTVATSGGVLQLAMSSTSGHTAEARRTDYRSLVGSHLHMEIPSLGNQANPAVTVTVELAQDDHYRFGIKFISGVMRAFAVVNDVFGWLGAGVAATAPWIRFRELSGTVTIEYADTYDALQLGPTTLYSGATGVGAGVLQLRLQAQSGGAASGHADFDSINTTPPPVLVEPPKIVPNIPRSGRVSTVDIGVWKYMDGADLPGATTQISGGGPNPIYFTVTWSRAVRSDSDEVDWHVIAGATDIHYTPQSADLDEFLRVDVTAHNEGAP